MKKVFAFVGILALVLAFTATSAFAADLKASVTGKVTKGEKSTTIKVDTAKGEDGKDIADLKGKDIEVKGDKLADVQKLAGKDVTAKGAVTDNASINVTSVEEKKAEAAKPAAPAAKPAAPAAKPAAPAAKPAAPAAKK